MPQVRAEIAVRGVVQGVGYRFFALETARTLNLTGYVRNMPDGGVEVLVEGQRGLVEELIGRLKTGPRGAAVRGMSVRWSRWRGEFKDFRVRF